MEITEALSRYIRTNGITLFSIIRRTGISKTAIYSSLGDGGKRKLRVEEYYKICSAIGVNPTQFFNDQQKGA